MPHILGVRVDAIEPAELEGKLRGFLIEGGLHKVFTPNAEMILKAHWDGSFKEVLNRGDLNLADGVSLVFASLYLNFLNTKVVHRSPNLMNTNCAQKIENRVTGVDTLELLCKIAAEDGYNILLFGSNQGVAESAAEQIKKRYPGLSIKGLYPGIVSHSGGDWRLEHGSIDTIKAEAPDILAVALGHGKQEHFICSALEGMPSIKIAIGVGGALDYLSGNVTRAPKWVRRAGFEWLYRLIKQPTRIGRIIDAVVVFPLIVVWDRIKALW